MIGLPSSSLAENSQFLNVPVQESWNTIINQLHVKLIEISNRLLRSSLVQFFGPNGLEPRPRPVLQNPNCSKDWTKPVRTGPSQSFAVLSSLGAGIGYLYYIYIIK